jgi:hypothetical protein
VLFNRLHFARRLNQSYDGGVHFAFQFGDGGALLLNRLAQVGFDALQLLKVQPVLHKAVRLNAFQRDLQHSPPESLLILATPLNFLKTAQQLAFRLGDFCTTGGEMRRRVLFRLVSNVKHGLQTIFGRLHMVFCALLRRRES